jgi:hypothetical protein
MRGNEASEAVQAAEEHRWQLTKIPRKIRQRGVSGTVRGLFTEFVHISTIHPPRTNAVIHVGVRRGKSAIPAHRYKLDVLWIELLSDVL